MTRQPYGAQGQALIWWLAGGGGGGEGGQSQVLVTLKGNFASQECTGIQLCPKWRKIYYSLAYILISP